MRIKAIEMPVVICLIGGASFWAPVVLCFAIFKLDTSFTLMNLAVIGASIGCFCILKKKANSQFVGSWMFLGIHLIGPFALNGSMKFVGAGFFQPNIDINIGKLILLSFPPLFWWVASMFGVFGILVVVPLLGWQALVEWASRKPPQPEI